MTVLLPAIVFDIDGTLANTAHRQHYVQNKPKNWAKFNDMMIHDTMHEDIFAIYHTFLEAGNAILIASGREEKFRKLTEDWFLTWGIDGYHHMYMRPTGDNRSDDIVKEEILMQMRLDGYDPWLVFDDRDRVVAMWRRNGIRCLQVAPGDF